MKAASKAVADCLAKPEAFVVVAVMDEQDLIWGGEDTPCALCNLASLGSINKANNTRLSGAITALMSEFDVRPDRCTPTSGTSASARTAATTASPLPRGEEA